MQIPLKKDRKIRVAGSFDLFTIMRDILLLEDPNDRSKEHFWTISLDHGQTILNIELVSLGTATKAPVEPMEVFSVPLQKKAVKLVLVHNHPSGLLNPSADDKDITDRLIQVGLIMRVPVIDHLIISEENFYSFADNGLLAELSKSLKYVPAYMVQQRYEQLSKEKGKEEGVKETKKEIVRKMRAQGYDVEAIATITGLSKASIVKIKD
ncbi:MAG: DNA repair protein [Bacteroidetes bacterium]|nr:DNA repair protein [Bacteroidota bacterium]